MLLFRFVDRNELRNSTYIFGEDAEINGRLLICPNLSVHTPEVRRIYRRNGQITRIAKHRKIVCLVDS